MLLNEECPFLWFAFCIHIKWCVNAIFISVDGSLGGTGNGESEWAGGFRTELGARSLIGREWDESERMRLRGPQLLRV